MLFAVLVSALSAMAAACLVVLFQAVTAQQREALSAQHRPVAELARKTKGVLTPAQVSEHMGIPVVEADRLLRSMVDDRYCKMKVDDRRGEIVFWFTELTHEPNRSDSFARNVQHTPRPKPEPLTTARN